MMDETLSDLGEYLTLTLGDSLLSTEIAYDELSISVVSDDLPKVIKFLRDDSRCLFSVLIDVCGVDYPQRDKRFDVVYHFLSPRQNQRIRVKLQTDEASKVPSIVELFPAANWFEREAFDMYGILFDKHPDLRRILTDYGFKGYPLRKDFPVTGYVEVRYNDDLKRVVYEPVKLTQEFRSFDFMSPWEGAEYILPGDEKANNDTPEKA